MSPLLTWQLIQDDQEFDRVVVECSPWLRRLIIAIVRCEATAEDVLQEVWLTILRVRKGRTGPLAKAFLYKVAHNAALKAIPKLNRERGRGNVDAEGDLLNSPEAAEHDGGASPQAELIELLRVLAIREGAHEEVVDWLLTIILEKGTLLHGAIEILISVAEPPLDQVQRACFERRWLSDQSLLQIGRELNPAFHNQAATGDPANAAVTNWASSRCKTALRQIIKGLKNRGLHEPGLP